MYSFVHIRIQVNTFYFYLYTLAYKCIRTYSNKHNCVQNAYECIRFLQKYAKNNHYL